MYQLYTQQTDGVWLNQWEANTVQQAKVYADQYYPHANCKVMTTANGEGTLITSRTATGSWQ